jgi:type II secretory pathway pseudopilin PulG
MKNSQKGFSIVEVIFYLLIVIFIFFAAFSYYQGNIVRIRDEKRKEDLNILKEKLEQYFSKNNIYPISDSWICLEKSQILKEISAENIQDPLFSQDSQNYCYRYKSAKEGKEFKIYAISERDGKIIEVFSKEGKNIFSALPNLDPWYNPNWHARKRILISSKNLSTEIKDFPYFLEISDKDLINEKEDKILFFDPENNKKIEREIIKFDKDKGNLLAFLKIPNLFPQKDKKIYLYFDNDKISEKNSQETYDNNYLAIFHFDEIGLPINSLSNNIYAICEKDSIEKVDGKIGKAANFDGENSLKILGLDKLRMDKGFTFQAWIFPKGEKIVETIETTTPSEINTSTQEESEEENLPQTSSSTKVISISKIVGTDNKEFIEKPILTWQDIKGNFLELSLSFFVTSSTSIQNNTSTQESIDGSFRLRITNKEITFPQKIKLNEWSFIALTISDNEVYFFVQGEGYKETISFEKKDLRVQNYYFLVGKNVRGDVQEAQENNYFTGFMDEIFISKIPRDESWLNFTFENQNSPQDFVKKIEDKEIY